MRLLLILLVTSLNVNAANFYYDSPRQQKQTEINLDLGFENE